MPAPAQESAAPPVIPPRREGRAWVAFTISALLHVGAAALVWQWAPVFLPQMETPPLQVHLSAGNEGDAARSDAASAEPPPLPQPKPFVQHRRKPAAVPAPVAIASAPQPSPELVPPMPAIEAPPVPDALADGPGASASTQTAAEAASVRILAWLSQHRRYPPAARRARLEGVVEIVVVLLPDGRLVEQRIAQSSGHAVLDQAALELLRRASPVPAATFETGDAAQLELHLPIVYRLSI